MRKLFLSLFLDSLKLASAVPSSSTFIAAGSGPGCHSPTLPVVVCFPPDKQSGSSTLSPPWEAQPPQSARGEQSLLPAEDGGGDAVWRWSGVLQRHERPTRMDLEGSWERNSFPCLRLEVWTFLTRACYPFCRQKPGLLVGDLQTALWVLRQTGGSKKNKEKVEENVGYKGKSCGESSTHEPQG